MIKPQLVRVTRTIRQTYFVRVDNAATKTEAREVALAITDEWGDGHNPHLSVSPWGAASRDNEPGLTDLVHATADAKSL